MPEYPWVVPARSSDTLPCSAPNMGRSSSSRSSSRSPRRSSPSSLSRSRSGHRGESRRTYSRRSRRDYRRRRSSSSRGDRRSSGRHASRSPDRGRGRSHGSLAGNAAPAGNAGQPEPAKSPVASAPAAQSTPAPAEKHSAPTPMKTSALAANKLSPGGHTRTTQVAEGLTSLTRSNASEVATDGSTDDGSTDGSNRKRRLVLVEGTSAPVKMDIAAKAVRASASAANEPAGGDSRKRKAETQEPPPIEEDICKGVVRRAAAWRQKYNPSRKKRKLHVDSCGFHMLNRDGIACNGDRCDELTGQIVHDGTDPD